MTLEEAKKEIKRLADCQLSKFDKNPNQQAWRKARAYENAYDILDEIDTEPVVKDKMTLEELAHELRKIFKFKYLTVDEDFRNDNKPTIAIWKDRPEFNQWNEWEMGLIPCNGCFDVEMLNIAEALDLSEYKDADGNVDYSRCIVEVE